jgi:hypothetical protein
MEWLHNTFIVKITGGTSLHPRGYVEHLSTQERVYFDCFELMNRFVSKCLETPPGEEIQMNPDRPGPGASPDGQSPLSPGDSNSPTIQ